jgi:hypothetical protein
MHTPLMLDLMRVVASEHERGVAARRLVTEAGRGRRSRRSRPGRSILRGISWGTFRPRPAGCVDC